jgi:hypothetical protein
VLCVCGFAYVGKRVFVGLVMWKTCVCVFGYVENVFLRVWFSQKSLSRECYVLKEKKTSQYIYIYIYNM